MKKEKNHSGKNLASKEQIQNSIPEAVNASEPSQSSISRRVFIGRAGKVIALGVFSNFLLANKVNAADGMGGKVAKGCNIVTDFCLYCEWNCQEPCQLACQTACVQHCQDCQTYCELYGDTCEKQVNMCTGAGDRAD